MTNSWKPQSGIRQGQHFVTFVHHHGCLWELDGRRDEPTFRGKTSNNNTTFVQDAVTQIQKILSVTTPDSTNPLRCSLMAFISMTTQQGVPEK